MSRCACRLRQHAERGAGLEPQRLDALDHGADLHRGRGPWASARPRPCRSGWRRPSCAARASASTASSAISFSASHAGVVARALRAIGAVLRAAAGLDRQQRRNLHLGRIEMLAGGRSARGTSGRGTAARTAPATSSRVQSWRDGSPEVRIGKGVSAKVIVATNHRGGKDRFDGSGFEPRNHLREDTALPYWHRRGGQDRMPRQPAAHKKGPAKIAGPLMRATVTAACLHSRGQFLATSGFGAS